jgi:hypothetical protein
MMHVELRGIAPCIPNLGTLATSTLGTEFPIFIGHEAGHALQSGRCGEEKNLYPCWKLNLNSLVNQLIA